jgi:hypothetical protein
VGSFNGTVETEAIAEAFDQMLDDECDKIILAWNIFEEAHKERENRSLENFKEKMDWLNEVSCIGVCPEHEFTGRCPTSSEFRNRKGIWLIFA